MKALILYFSGTGNTRYVAEKINELLKAKGEQTEIHSIEEKFELKPNTFNRLILGCPKYYEYPVLDFIRYLKEKIPVSKKSIPTMFFCTQAGPLKTDLRETEKILKRKNYHLIVSKSIAIANNLTIFNIFPLTGEEEIKHNLKKLEKDLPPLVDDFINRKVNKEHVSLLMGTICHLCGVLFTKAGYLFRVKYSASSDCTGCGLCAKKCPKRNIYIEDKKPRFRKKCVYCMRCINSCPVNAILYNKKQRTQYHEIK